MNLLPALPQHETKGEPMKIRSSLFTVMFAGIALIAASQMTSAAEQAQAQMMSADGESVGIVALHKTPHGTLLHATLHNLPEGTHAFHVHTVGKCEAPFKSAGGHFNPEGKSHGILSADGMHVGDMPNIHVPASGSLEIEILNTHLMMDSALFDDDGAAIMIHAGADDYRSDPAGAAGPRIACGVISK